MGATMGRLLRFVVLVAGAGLSVAALAETRSGGAAAQLQAALPEADRAYVTVKEDGRGVTAHFDIGAKEIGAKAERRIMTPMLRLIWKANELKVPELHLVFDIDATVSEAAARAPRCADSLEGVGVWLVKNQPPLTKVTADVRCHLSVSR